MPWIWPSRILPTVLGIVLVVAVVVTWRAARRHPEWLLATGLVLASVAYPLALLLALVLMRRAGRATAASG